jgi:hypothetical protein
MYSHSTVGRGDNWRLKSIDDRLIVDPPAMRRSTRCISPVNISFFDAGADGDTEKSPTNPYFGTCFARAMCNPWKRPFNFPNACEPTALARRSSKTVDTSLARPRKRQRVPGRDSAADGASVCKTPTKKRKIADPTFRLGTSSESEEVVVERRRKRINKRVRTKDKRLTKFLSPEAERETLQQRGDVIKMEDQHANREVGDAMGVEEEAIRRENEEHGDAKDERSDKNDDEDVVWERDWCRVM